MKFVRTSAVLLAVGVGVWAGAATAEEPSWSTDFQATLARAKAEKKLVLANFTGSDWCGWCMRLKQEVFDQDKFRSEAPKKFVLAEFDYPHQKELPEALQKQNETLAQRYNVHGFPTVLLLDAEGNQVASTGYQPGGPEAYVKQLDGFVTAYQQVLALRKQLDKVKGIERAKLLDQLVDAYATLNNTSEDVDAFSKEIVALDPDNKAGLKHKHEFRLLLAEADHAKQNRDFPAALAALEKALALPGVTPAQRHEAYFAEGECYFNGHDFVGVVASLKKALEAQPDGPQVETIQEMLQRFGPMAAAQEAVNKLSAEAPKAKGVERARLLDQLIDARRKLDPLGRDPAQAAAIEKDSQEIIQLDADGKAGLKAKYEFLAQYSHAVALARHGETDKALEALDKTLTLPGIKPEQIQDCQLLRGQMLLGRHESAKGVEALKLALKAAPDAPKAAQIKRLIEHFEKPTLRLPTLKPVPDK